METCRFEFTGLHGRPAACGIERIDLPDGRVVIITTELPENPGVSITDFAKQLAGIVCQRFSIDPKKLVWIEHYPCDPCPVCRETGVDARYDLSCRGCGGNGKRKESATYDLVTFAPTADISNAFGESKWRRIQQADWQRIGIVSRQ